MHKRTLIALLITIAVLAIAVTSVGAITDGQLDGENHPFVGLMVAFDGDYEPLWRCSGTLLSPTLFLTAGHCVKAPAAHAVIWFDTDVESLVCERDDEGNLIPADDCYPYGGGDSYTGTPYGHPDFDPEAFYLYDLGVVILDGEGAVKDTYGILPQQDQLDALTPHRGKHDTMFTAVGYGLQESFPDAASWKENSEKVRYVAYPILLQLNAPGMTGDYSMLLSNNHVTGGTCYGDSGGPNFLGDSNVVAGVTSFGINVKCAGVGGVYRLDRADDLNWLYDTFGDHLPLP